MTRRIKAGRHPEKQLTARGVDALRVPGRYMDGQGLMLVVTPSGSRNWIQRLVINGRRRDLGLGGYPLVTLAKARETALENRRVARAGGDPTAGRLAVPTFKESAAQFFALNASSWAPKTATLWQRILELHAYPKVGRVRVDAITGGDLLAVLSPLWTDRRSTASRLKGQLSQVLEFAAAQGHEIQPSTDGRALSRVLPKRTAPVEHHPAAHYSEVADIIRKVRESGAHPTTRLCFEFALLTAARSGEARGCVWSEIDLKAKVWTVPPSRMKARKVHRIPLSRRAIEVLREAAAYRGHDPHSLVFPSMAGKQIDQSTVIRLLRGLDVDGVTFHGMRSSFRMWVAERTNTPRDVAEAALAHSVGDATQQAYDRSDKLDRRRKLMESWSAFLGDQRAGVIRIA